MTAKNKVAVKIGGKDYTLVGLESGEYIHQLASYIDKKLIQVQKINPKLSTSMVAVLTSVNVADDYFKSVQTEAAAIEKLDQADEEIQKLRLQLSQLSREIEILNEKNVSMAMELGEFKLRYERTPKVRFYSK